MDPDGRLTDDPPGQTKRETFEQYCIRVYGKFNPEVSPTPPSHELRDEAIKRAVPIQDQVDELVSVTHREWGFDVRLVDGRLAVRGPYTDNDAGGVCSRNGKGTFSLMGHGHPGKEDFGESEPSGFASGRGGDKALAIRFPTVILLFAQPGGQR